ncbi:protein tyrosine phosphatase [Bradyrhizobium sp. 31Argb]|uniref:arsenate reductase/protein-tyrosine-phosphatase family protein n=1 Tax=Bradyrhizobium sp. 31Argb TaxID=3141247 RepID=UPI00374A193B
MADGRYNVLFLSNRNSARSIFAEAVLNRIGRERFTGFSAGLRPASQLDELAIDVLRVAEYRPEGLHPKHWKEFAKADAPPLDFVFTLCDIEAGEPLPHWPGRPVTGDWRYPDPARYSDQRERRTALAATLGGLERQILAFMQLPFRSLDEISLRERLKELGQGVSFDDHAPSPNMARKA